MSPTFSVTVSSTNRPCSNVPTPNAVPDATNSHGSLEFYRPWLIIQREAAGGWRLAGRTALQEDLGLAVQVAIFECTHYRFTAARVKESTPAVCPAVLKLPDECDSTCVHISNQIRSFIVSSCQRMDLYSCQNSQCGAPH
jgi:hypothetical protein